MALHFEAALQCVGAARVLRTVAVADAVGNAFSFGSPFLAGEMFAVVGQDASLMSESGSGREGLKLMCGRDDHCWPPPAQIRAGGIPAMSRRGKTRCRTRSQQSQCTVGNRWRTLPGSAFTRDP